VPPLVSISMMYSPPDLPYALLPSPRPAPHPPVVLHRPLASCHGLTLPIPPRPPVPTPYLKPAPSAPNSLSISPTPYPCPGPDDPPIYLVSPYVPTLHPPPPQPHLPSPLLAYTSVSCHYYCRPTRAPPSFPPHPSFAPILALILLPLPLPPPPHPLCRPGLRSSPFLTSSSSP